MTTLIPTGDPALFVVPAESSPGRYYVVRTDAGDVEHVEAVCPAGKFGNECKHTETALAVATSHMEEHLMTQEVTVIPPAEERHLADRGAARQLDRSLAVRTRAQNLWANFLDAKNFAQALHDAALVPSRRRKVGDDWIDEPTETVEATTMKVMKALALDVDPISAMSWLYVVGGKVATQGEGQLALIGASGRGHIEFTESTDVACTAIGYRNGYRRPLQVRLTIEAAQDAGYIPRQLDNDDAWKGNRPWGGSYNKNWRYFPAQHLRYKCAGYLAKAMFADVCAGLDVLDATGEMIETSDEGDRGFEVTVLAPEQARIEMGEAAEPKSSLAMRLAAGTVEGVEATPASATPEPAPAAEPAPPARPRVTTAEVRDTMAALEVTADQLATFLGGAKTIGAVNDWLATNPERDLADCIQAAKPDEPFG